MYVFSRIMDTNYRLLGRRVLRGAVANFAETSDSEDQEENPKGRKYMRFCALKDSICGIQVFCVGIK